MSISKRIGQQEVGPQGSVNHTQAYATVEVYFLYKQYHLMALSLIALLVKHGIFHTAFMWYIESCCSK